MERFQVKKSLYENATIKDTSKSLHFVNNDHRFKNVQTNYNKKPFMVRENQKLVGKSQFSNEKYNIATNFTQVLKSGKKINYTLNEPISTKKYNEIKSEGIKGFKRSK